MVERLEELEASIPKSKEEYLEQLNEIKQIRAELGDYLVLM